MYDDGYGSANITCATPSAPGCWGHRDNILGNYRVCDGGEVVAGHCDGGTWGYPAALSYGGGAGRNAGGLPAFTALIVATPVPLPTSATAYSWAAARRAGAGESRARRLSSRPSGPGRSGGPG